MTTEYRSVRLPLLLSSLAALLLLLCTGFLVLAIDAESVNNDRQQTAFGLSRTTEQLATLIASDNSADNADGNSSWVRSDELAMLVAISDVQVEKLAEPIGAVDLLSFGIDLSADREISADWKLLRQGLLSVNNQSDRSNRSVTPAQTTVDANPVVSPAASPAANSATNSAEPAVIEVPENVLALATGFEQIRARVTEGTRLRPLLDLVNNSSLLWKQINDSRGAGLRDLVARQKVFAEDLLLLSKAGTGSSLYGYYTSNQILDYAQQVRNIQLPIAESGVATPVVPAPIEPAPIEPAPLVEEPEVVEEITTESADTTASTSNAFVTEALTQLRKTVARYLNTAANVGTRIDQATSAALAGLALAFLLLLAALFQMFRASKSVAAIDADSYSGQSDVLSFKESDQLMYDISAVADGDLRHSVRVPASDHGGAIAESVNRSAAVTRNLVSLTRGVARRIDSVVRQHNKLDQALAKQDINRQSETAELSDGLGVRSGTLNQQQLTLANSSDLINEIKGRTDSAVNGVGQVSTSLARLSAQVDVSNGRMQRLSQAVAGVSESTGKLKLTSEQARLLALNVSLKMSERAPSVETAGEFDDSVNYGDQATGMFDDIHLLTGKLVQMSADTDSMISKLQADIEETTRSLKESSSEINDSARHTHSTSLIGKELAGFSEQLSTNVTEALASIETQKNELSQTARHIVRLDKNGNDTSELTMALTQDVVELQAMATKLEDAVAGFRLADAGVKKEAPLA